MSSSVSIATPAERRVQWRVIVALNGVSALAQIGQFGIAFILFPVVLEARGASALHIGVVSSALWIGNLAGLVLAPRLISRLGYRKTVLLGLVSSAIALLLTPVSSEASWTIWAVFSGFGYGLRWIGNETWLFGISPAEAQGKIVGLHESLLAVAAVVGPALIALTAGQPMLPFTLAAVFTLAAALPLWMAGSSQMSVPAKGGTASSRVRGLVFLMTFASVGPLIAGAGGLIEGGTISMFPVFASSVGLDTERTAWTLSLFGLGAMVLQFPLGWLADAKGFKSAVVCTSLVTMVFAVVVMALPADGMAFNAAIFVLGGAITGFLTLGIVAAARSSDPEVLAAEISRVSISFTLLSAIGPLLASGLVTFFGTGAVMAFAAVGGVLGLLPLLRWPRSTL